MEKPLSVLLAVTACLAYPVFEFDQRYLRQKETLHYHELGEEVYFAWKLVEDSLFVSVKFPITVKWLVLGFTTPNIEITEMSEMAWVRVNPMNNIKVKNADWDVDDGFSKSSSRVWQKSKVESDENNYIVAFTRPLLGLEWSSPMTMVYAYGSESKLVTINNVFKSRYKQVSINLSSHLTFNVTSSPPTTSPLTTEHPQTVKGISHEKEFHLPQQNAIDKPTPKTTSITTQPPATELKTSQTTPTKTTEVVKSSEKASKLHEKQEASETNKTTHCPSSCNCTMNQQRDDQSHWYDLIKTKENSVFIAIIGVSALLAGIIVLCIACCCARGSSRIPKSRKHKVAFYKVDDFETGDEIEEELEFIAKEKK